ncbi:MAG: PstS family phosphate ABC transporter substrate-binding protein [Acidobacteriota bacterium]
MRKIATISLIALLSIVGALPALSQKQELSGTITLSGAWSLYPMALRWGEEFQKIHPKVRIDVQAGGAGKGIADALVGAVDFGMVSRGIHPAEMDKGAFPISVCKDAVVPTLSEKNPLLTQVLKAGVKKERFVAIWIAETAKTWGDVLGTADKTALHVYTRSDACGAAETWAEYLGGRQEDLGGVGVYGDPGLAEAVRRDALAVGFNNINFAYDAKTKKPLPGLAILPLDLNGNGSLDEAESFYEDRDTITVAIARGAYPSPPARDLYLVGKGKPAKPLLLEFLRWILSDGQNYVSETGYISLSQEKLAEGLKKIGAR